MADLHPRPSAPLGLFRPASQDGGQQQSPDPDQDSIGGGAAVFGRPDPARKCREHSQVYGVLQALDCAALPLRTKHRFSRQRLPGHEVLRQRAGAVHGHHAVQQTAAQAVHTKPNSRPFRTFAPDTEADRDKPQPCSQQQPQHCLPGLSAPPSFAQPAIERLECCVVPQARDSAPQNRRSNLALGRVLTPTVPRCVQRNVGQAQHGFAQRSTARRRANQPELPLHERLQHTVLAPAPGTLSQSPATNLALQHRQGGLTTFGLALRRPHTQSLLPARKHLSQTHIPKTQRHTPHQLPLCRTLTPALEAAQQRRVLHARDHSRRSGSQSNRLLRLAVPLTECRPHFRTLHTHHSLPQTTATHRLLSRPGMPALKRPTQPLQCPLHQHTPHNVLRPNRPRHECGP